VIPRSCSETRGIQMGASWMDGACGFPLGEQ